jgi:hypothetical protein
MRNYNLTDAQKDLLRSLVEHTKAGELKASFFVHEQPDPKKAGAFLCWVDLDSGNRFEFASKSDLDWLCEHAPPLMRSINQTYHILQAGFDAVDSNFYPYAGILLEPAQEELLVRIVEAARNVPPDQRGKFMIVESKAGARLSHPGLPEARAVFPGDVEVLVREDLLAPSYGSADTSFLDVLPLGFRHYEYLKWHMGDAASRMESTIRNFLDANEFRRRYLEAYRKWSSAEELLWRADKEEQFTTIGHLCREATQEFATALVERHKPLNVTSDKTQTVARLRAVFDVRSQQLGSTVKPFLKALLAYWGTLIDLIQRQVHGAAKEGEQLVWEDARRVVFQTAIVMFEIDKAQ